MIEEQKIEPAEPNAAAIAARKKREENEARKAEREENKPSPGTRKIAGTQYGGSKQKEVDEEVEQIDELSKGTLGRYIKKANKNTYHAAYIAGEGKYKKQAGEYADKRAKGIEKAVSKLTKESIETPFTSMVESYKEGGIKSLFESLSLTEAVSQKHPLEGHEYHKKSNEQLHYIVKDAGEAETANRGNPAAENKYADQKNDASTVLHYRKQHGGTGPEWYAKKYGHSGVKESVREEATEDEFNKELAKAKDKAEGKGEKAEVAKAAVQAVQKEEVEQVEERHLTPDEKKEVEKNVKGMKKKLAGFKERYGDRAKEVMYATAVKQAKED